MNAKRTFCNLVFAGFILQCAISFLAIVPSGHCAEAQPTTFPAELVHWKPLAGNPVFLAAGSGHWDTKIRERGWILRSDNSYRMWYTGYDGTREGTKFLGYATSLDGLHWTRSARNPLFRNEWVEDMMVVEHGGAFYMFAEGCHDNHSVLLTSRDGLEWKWEGELDVLSADGTSSAKRPCGTPTVWIDNGTWYLFYEWLDQGVWLARATDSRLRTWKNVQEKPVLRPGPGDYDREMIAMNQVVRCKGAYFALYHGSGSGSQSPRTWNTNIARSTDLIHWEKYAGNPIVGDNKSSGIVVPVAGHYRLYTMHNQVDAFESAISQE